MSKKLEDKDVEMPDDIMRSTADDILRRARLIENEMKMLKNEAVRLTHEQAAFKERIKENNDKIKLNKQLPYLVGNVVEVRAKSLVVSIHIHHIITQSFLHHHSLQNMFYVSSYKFSHLLSIFSHHSYKIIFLCWYIIL